VLDIEHAGRRVGIVVEDAAQAISIADDVGVTPEVIDLNLDEVFEAYVAGKGRKKVGT